MRNIFLFGAFDRYNYGDNLMPILFHKFIEKYYPTINEKINIHYIAISESNLEQYLCEKSFSMRKMTSMLKPGDSILVIGGEVLTATNAILFLHMQTNYFLNKFLTFAKRIIKNKFSIVSDKFYSTQWEYPFVIPKNFLPENVKVLYNTVGGGFGGIKSEQDKLDVIHRLRNADYFSVRDCRTQNRFEEHCDVVLSPDSALIMSDLITNEFLETKISSKVKDLVVSDYLVFQSAPDKLGSSTKRAAVELDNLCKQLNYKLILLPIGYASGHDDKYVLRDIYSKVETEAYLVEDLNIWEIMYIIKNSKLFLGTSLHGVITAISFGIPYFGINRQVEKLDAFLGQWSVPMLDRCYPVEEISEILNLLSKELMDKIEENRIRLINLVLNNNHKMVDLILKD